MVTIMNEPLQEAIHKYREPYTGLVGLTPYPTDHSTDNGLLFSSLYCILTGVDYLWLLDQYLRCEKLPGLPRRYPDDPGDGDHDDITGMATASWKFSGGIVADRLYQYGKANWWCWNVERPGKWEVKYCWGRFPGFIAFLKAAAGHKLNFFDQVSFFIGTVASTLLSKDPGDTNGKCLQYLKNLSVSGKYWLTDIAIRYWKREMAKQYPTGMKGCYAIYFGPTHPFALYGPEDFG